MSQSNAGSALECIVGRRVDAVCFVLDYITFQFGDLVLAALADPLLTKSDKLLSLGQAGYRDGLCSEIGESVVSVSETIERLEITLTQGTKIIVPINALNPPGTEMATLSGKGQFVNAWLRPTSA
jgi:hypothetical protein